MSILIKNMEMPKDCRECPLEMYYMNCGETRCRAARRTLATDFESIPFDGRADNCPLNEIPPHGRLIDADALRYLYEPWENEKEQGIDIDKYVVNVAVVRANIDDAPTIIEAEEET